jgi:AcrR family transcriptional regulator
LVLARARVSRRTFYACFGGLEDCLVVLMDGALGQLLVLAVRGLEAQDCWRDGVRCALAAVLEFFDSRPGLARVCIVEMLAGGASVLAHRERMMAVFRAVVVERIEREVPYSSPLAAEGVMASVLGVMHAHIVTGQREPLIALLGPLMGLASAPYLDREDVEREIERGNQMARELLRGGVPWAPRRGDVRGGVPDALLTVRAHRARLCLLYVAQHPGASNQQVAAGIGASHRGQVSRLLGRLAGLGLLVKHAGAPGRPNAWVLSTAGEQVALALVERE